MHHLCYGRMEFWLASHSCYITVHVTCVSLTFSLCIQLYPLQEKPLLTFLILSVWSEVSHKMLSANCSPSNGVSFISLCVNSTSQFCHTGGVWLLGDFTWAGVLSATRHRLLPVPHHSSGNPYFLNSHPQKYYVCISSSDIHLLSSLVSYHMACKK